MIFQFFDVEMSQGYQVKNTWILGKDYYRLDGKTPKLIRHEMIEQFNSMSNKRARVFLISSRAGGQGINLTGANRVIILDTSWNPSNDQQNIFRVFRLGQKKNCYIYRLLAMVRLHFCMSTKILNFSVMIFFLIFLVFNTLPLYIQNFSIKLLNYYIIFFFNYT